MLVNSMPVVSLPVLAVADACVTRLVLVPIVEEVMFSGEHGRLVNEKPTNEDQS